MSMKARATRCCSYMAIRRGRFCTENLSRALWPPGYFRAASGREYEVMFTSRSGERFPSGLEIHALVPGFDPVDPEATDEDIWRFLEWLIPRVGGEWTLEALKATGKVYKIPWA